MAPRTPILTALWVLLAASSAHAVERSTEPVRRIDRMWAVGSPVLEEGKAGVYAWVEDRAVQLAARAGRSGRGVYRVRVRATEDLDLSQLSGFRVVAKAAENNVLLEATVKGAPARGAVRSKGDITLSDAERSPGKPARVFVGPLARPAASTVVIGRF